MARKQTDTVLGGAGGGSWRLRLAAKTPILRGVVDLLTSRHYVVRGGSMRPQCDPGQRLLASRLAYLRSEPSRGDLVVVRDPREGGAHYLKRIIGLPGEVVSVDDGMLFVDGVPLDEPYLGGLPASLGLDRADWSVGDGHYFVMGDYRARSTDSREFGPVARHEIIGKVWLRYWPLRRFGSVAAA